MDYQFLLGRAFNIDDQTYVVSALSQADGQTIVRAGARIEGEQVMRVFPATLACRNLLCDEEIELKVVSFMGR